MMCSIEWQWCLRREFTWKASVLMVMIDGVWIRSNRVIDCVNVVKLWFVDFHDWGKWVIVFDEVQSIVWGCTQVQSVKILNRCGQLLLLVFDDWLWFDCNSTKSFQVKRSRRRKKRIWYWLKTKNKNNENPSLDWLTSSIMWIYS